MSLREINRMVERAMGQAERATEFLAYARHIARNPDDPLSAYKQAEKELPNGRPARVLKAAVTAGGTGDPSWAAPLVDYQIMSAGFLESLRSLSVFDALLAAGIKKIPLEQRLAIVAVALVGGGVAQAAVKPVSTMSLDVAALVPTKAIAMIVASEELLRFSTPSAITLFNAELRAAVAAASDLMFLSSLYASTTPTASAGPTIANILTDLKTLLNTVAPLANSKTYLVCRPEAARALVLARSPGGPVFPGARLDGGEVLPGVGLLVSDQQPVGTALMLDAAAIVGGSDVVTVDSSRYSTLQLSTTPDSPPTASTGLESLFQSGRAAVKCERLFGWDVVRANGVASLSGVAW